MNASSERLLATVNQELQRRWRIVEAGAAARGVSIQIHSGFRSREHQQRLYNNRASNPNPVAPPGLSPHEFGVAIDATPIPRTSASWRVLWDEARKAGLVLGVNFTRRDPPHFELPGFVHGSATQNVATRPQSQPVPSLSDTELNNYSSSDDDDPYSGSEGDGIPLPMIISGVLLFMLVLRRL